MADIPGTGADGNVKVVFVPAIADTSAPTVTELTATGAVDVSCYLTADGWTPGLDEQTVTDERLCSTATYEQPGRSQRSLDIKYVENPGDDTNNKAATSLTKGTKGFFVVRRGPEQSTEFAEDDVVDVWPVTMGAQAKQPPEANSVLQIAQKAFVTGEVQQDVTVAAGA